MHKYNKIITNWVLWGQFSTMDMTWDAWSYLVLVRNDQKKTLSRPKWCQPLVIVPVHHVDRNDG